MKYCLEIHVTLTEELGAVLPPSHSWMAPSWKICCMMLGPDLPKQWWWGQVGQFFSMGDVQWERVLTMDEARDATFLHTGAGTWVGKSAYLATDPLTIQEGRRAIAQAISDCQVKAMGPGIPVWICQPNKPSGFIPWELSLWRMHLGMVVLIVNHHPVSPQEVENVIDIGETKGLHHLGSPHLPWTVGLRVTRAHYEWLPWYHLGLIGQIDPDTPKEVDGIERMELAWR